MEVVRPDELQHWGIKGMKWGVRRYQNKDGSLTPAGQKRYNQEMERVEKEKAKLTEKERIQRNKHETQAKLDKLKAEKESIKARKKSLKDGPQETDEEKRERLLKSTDAKEIYENRHLLTYNELAERANRLDVEARIKGKIVTEKAKTGMDYIDDAANNINKVTNLYKKVDDAYKTVTTSAIGGVVAKKLGLEPPKKEFNLADVWKNRNKMSTKDLQDASQRVEAMNKIDQRLKTEKKQAAEDAAESARASAQKQVDDYVNSGYTRDSVRSTQYSQKGSDVVDNVYRTKTPLLTGPVQSTELSTYRNVGEKYVNEIYGKNGDFITYVDPLKHSDDNPDELQHWGIKGMKWGVRRYQNKDGSLTDAGKERLDKKKTFDQKITADKISKYYNGDTHSHTSTTKLSKSKIIKDMYDDPELSNARKELDEAYKMTKDFSNLSKAEVRDYKIKAIKILNDKYWHDELDDIVSDEPYLMYEDWDQGSQSSFALYLKDRGTDYSTHNTIRLKAEKNFREACENVVEKNLGQYADQAVKPANKYSVSTVRDAATTALSYYDDDIRYDSFGDSKKYMLEM